MKEETDDTSGGRTTTPEARIFEKAFLIKSRQTTQAEAARIVTPHKLSNSTS
jgi:hypothetical protein